MSAQHIEHNNANLKRNKTIRVIQMFDAIESNCMTQTHKRSTPNNIFKKEVLNKKNYTKI